MMQYTEQELARIVNERDEEELYELHEKIKESKYRCEYHIQTVTGLMNDPNGYH